MQLSEDDKQELQQQLSDKVQAVNELRDRIAEIEDAMHGTLDIIQDKDREMNRLRRQLAQMPQGQPEYVSNVRRDNHWYLR